MKRFLFAILIYFIVFGTANAQNLDWSWAKGVYSSNSKTEFAKDVAIDPINGDIVVVGDFSGDISAFYGPLFSGHLGGGFVAKYNSSGDFLWAFPIGGADNDRCNSIAIDNTGNIYVSGYMISICEFKGNSMASHELNSYGNKDAFVAKYNSDGLYQWAKHGGGTEEDIASTICLNSSQVIISGTYKGTVQFGTVTTNSVIDKQNVYIMAYDLNGNEQWLSDMEATEFEAREIVAGDANVFLIGDYKGLMDIYNHLRVKVNTIPDGNNWESYVISYKTSGAYNWISKIEGDGEQHGYSIAKKSSHLYITGWHNDDANLTGYSSNPLPKTGAGHDIYLAKIRKSDGVTQWAISEPGPNNDEATQICVDDSDLFVAGCFENNLSFSGDTTISSDGNKDVFVAKYDTDGNFYAVNSAGGTGREIPYGLATQNSVAYVVGEYKDDPAFGSFTLDDESNINIFVAKMGCPEITKNTITGNQTICATDLPTSLIGSLPAGGTAPLTYLWEYSIDGISWFTVTGTSNGQNYNPSLLATSTFFRRTVFSGVGCPNSLLSLPVLVKIHNEPTISDAGPDQTICTNNSFLDGNEIVLGAGNWTVLTGPSSISDSGLKNSAITGLSVGINRFIWKSTNGVCPSSSDTVIINVDENPTVSNAGLDQTICSDNSVLNAIDPAIGNGTWNLLSGTGIPSVSNNHNSGVTGLSIGTNEFTWTTLNGTCPISIDTIKITVDQDPTLAFAGLDQTICSANSVLAADDPVVGSGAWFVFSGSATLDDLNLRNTNVNLLSLGENKMVWTISNGVCPTVSDSVTIFIEENPTVANAGPDQTICTDNSILAANNPLVGLGTWSTISGTGVPTNVNEYDSGVTGLSLGINAFVWTISNGTCLDSKDTITINVDQNPTVSDAGSNQIICIGSTVLDGNIPSVGVGEWSLSSGTGIFVDSSLVNTTVNALSLGTNEMLWTITNGVCPSSSSSVTINLDEDPSVADVGADQTICSNSTLMTANLPMVGIGTWTLLAGSGGMSDINTHNATLSGLSIGVNQFIWTISNGTCLDSKDTITINVDQNPTLADAGIDQTICLDNSSIIANSPSIGTGIWYVSLGIAAIADVNSVTTNVTGLGLGLNQMTWTISNGVCPSSSNTVSIFVDENPTIANAGLDQTICNNNTIMTANPTTVGVGNWGLISGTGMASGFNDPSSGVFGLGINENKFTWTISNGVCPSSVDTVIIKVDENPTVSNAGSDQTICNDDATLLANIPSVGIGNWSVDFSTASIVDDTQYNSAVNGLNLSENRFVWTIINGVCPASRDTISIQVDENPTIANAGIDQTICLDNSVFLANTAVVGVGNWDLISGIGMVSGYNNPTSTVSGLAVGSAQFTWSINNGVCPSSIDTVIINVDENPSDPNAGLDQTICLPNSVLSAEAPSVGSGVWALSSGTGVVDDVNINNSTISELLAGSNSFLWTVSNGVCPVKTDIVFVNVDENPTVSNAGVDQTICSNISILSANDPLIGIGNWTTITGFSLVTDLNLYSSNVNTLNLGLNELVWTISNGTCPSSADTVEIFVDENPTVSDAGLDQVICANNSVFEANNPTVGNGIWGLVSGDGTFTTPNSEVSNVSGLGLSSNLFVWTISNGVCPISSDTISISVDENPTQADAGLDQIICDDQAFVIGNFAQIGSGSWSLYSGSGDILNENQSFSNVSNLGIGANGFIWTTSNGVCPSSTDTTYINVDEEPTVALAGDDHTICLDHYFLDANLESVGTSEWSVISGASSVSDVNQNNSEVTGLSLGLNELVWTISNGVCPFSKDTVLIQVDQEPSIALAGEDQVICIDTNILNANNVLVGVGSWIVLSGSSSVLDINNENSKVNDLSIGQNQLVWSISNGVCPLSKDTLIIQVDENPSIAFAGEDQTICDDENTLEGITSLVGLGAWTLEQGSGIFEDESIAGTSVSGLGIGTNEFVWTISNGVCASSSDTVLINVDDFPTQSIVDGDHTICIDTTELVANLPTVGIGEWSIITGSGILSDSLSEQPEVNDLSLGENAFVWIISNGVCEATADTAKVFVDEEPSIAFAGEDEMLCGNNTVLLANEPTVGLGEWTSILSSVSFENPNFAGSNVDNLEFGSDTLIWTISNGVCPSSTDTVIYNVFETPSVSLAGEDQVICEDQTVLEANVPDVGVGTWISLNDIVIVSDTNAENSNVSDLFLGENGFVWTITNGVCPNSSDTIIVNVDEEPSIALAGEDQELCSSTSVLNANSPNVGLGNWSLNSGTGLVDNITQASTNLSSLGIGINSFVWTISNGVCPSSSDTIVIKIDEQPSISDAGLDQDICEQNTILSANIPEIGFGLWSLNSGNGNISSVDIASTEIDGLGFGLNRLVWTISNGVCPSSSDTMLIRAFDFPSSANAGVDQAICDYETKLNANSPEIGIGNWSFLSGEPTFEDQMSKSSNISDLGIGKTILVWTISNGVCPVTKDSIIIQVDENPTVAEAGMDVITEKSSFVLDANNPSVGIGEWSVISGSTQFVDLNNSSAFIENLEIGENIFRWTIRNGVCLESSDEVMISAYEFKIPNGFSPNNDTYNDHFVIEGSEYFTEIKIEVFNKWGGMIYKNDDYDNSWNGTNMDGEPISDDTYYYIIKIDERSEAYTGFIVIKRK